jgi:hypothetical protein
MRTGITVVVIGVFLLIVGWIVWDFIWGRESRSVAESLVSEQKEADARVKLAFESLNERLPKGKPIVPAKPLSSEAKRRWDGFDQNVAGVQNMRAELLKALHEKTRRFFVESPGAGSGRQLFTPEMTLMDFVFSNQDQPQRGERANFPISPGEPLLRVEPNDEFYFHHDGGMRAFLHPTGFGYVKDRAHVAGFKPHGFGYLPVHESKHWRVHHILLIGILSHPDPVVYLTDKLPSMEQVRQGKTRPLDFFEEAGLASLSQGEDLYIAQKDDTLRMLGALRATKTCQQCHDAQIGDLLGAFSYTLRPSTAPQQETKQ